MTAEGCTRGRIRSIRFLPGVHTPGYQLFDLLLNECKGVFYPGKPVMEKEWCLENLLP
ncbi:MAG: hypothetical protein ACOCX0_01680 [Bacteroidota bacterium]